MIKYKIIEVHESEHSIVVRYYTDKITEEMLATDILDGVVRRGRTDYNINLPVPAPIGAALDKFIIDIAPVAWFETQELIKDNPELTSLSHIKELINQVSFIDNEPNKLILSQSQTLETLKKQKLMQLAANRYNKEISGINYLGYDISTKREDVGNLYNIYSLLKANITSSINYKTASNDFINLNIENIESLLSAITHHIQLYFDLEKNIITAIQSSVSEQQLEQININL